jgi:hypothetical protein
VRQLRLKDTANDPKSPKVNYCKVNKLLHTDKAILMFAKYYFNNPTHVNLPQSSKASCLGIVSLEAHSQVSAEAL